MSLLDILLGRTAPVSGDMSGSGGAIQPTGATAYQPLATEPASADGSGGGASSVFQMLYGSPEYKRQALQSSMMGLAAGLLKGAGPSTTPTSFLSALGQGLSGAQQGMDASRNNFARDMMLGAQFDSNRQNMAIQRQWMDYMRRQAGQGGAAPGGAPGGAPQPAGAAPSAAVAGRAPDGGPPPTDNNPGNLVARGGGFQAFDTPQAGIAELTRTVQNYPRWFNNGQPMTIQQIAMHAGPPDDGRNPMLRGNNPQQWARNVSAFSGLPADQPLDLNNPQVVTALVRGWHGAEKGRDKAFHPDIYQQGVQQAFGGRGQQAAQAGVSSPGLTSGAGLTSPGAAAPDLPRPRTEQEIAQLQPGTPFIDPRGNVRFR